MEVSVLRNLFLLTFALGTSQGHGPGKFDYFQSPHEDDLVPPDYPHQDEQFDGTQSLDVSSPTHGTVADMQTERTHDIFIRDRVVRSICSALTTFIQTGIPPLGKVKGSRSDGTNSDRCGWWKSVPCGRSKKAECGFDWVKCSDADFTTFSQSGGKSYGSPKGQGGSTRSGEPLNKIPVGEPGDESELNLQLPSSAEWQRRMASMANSTNKDDD